MSITYSDGNVYLECDECGNDVKVRLECISDSVYCSTCNRYLAVPVDRVLAKYRANSEERNQNRLDKEQRRYERIEDKKFARKYEKEEVETSSSEGSSLIMFLILGIIGTVSGITMARLFQSREIDDLNRQAEVASNDLNRAMDRFAGKSTESVNSTPRVSLPIKTSRSPQDSDIDIGRGLNQFEVFGITLGDIANKPFVGKRVFQTLDKEEIPFSGHPRVLLSLKSYLLVGKDIRPFTNDLNQPLGAIVYVGQRTNKIIGLSLQRFYANGKTEIVKGQGFRVVEEEGIKHYEDFLNDWNPIVRGMIQKYGVSSKNVVRPSHTDFGNPDSGSMLEWNKGNTVISITDLKVDIGCYMQVVYYDRILLSEENRLMDEEKARTTEILSPSRKEF